MNFVMLTKDPFYELIVIYVFQNILVVEVINKSKYIN